MEVFVIQVKERGGEARPRLQLSQTSLNDPGQDETRLGELFSAGILLDLPLVEGEGLLSVGGPRPGLTACRHDETNSRLSERPPPFILSLASSRGGRGRPVVCMV